MTPAKTLKMHAHSQNHLRARNYVYVNRAHPKRPKMTIISARGLYFRAFARETEAWSRMRVIWGLYNLLFEQVKLNLRKKGFSLRKKSLVKEGGGGGG